MDLDHVELTLLPAPDDPERVCYGIQAKLVEIQENLRQRGVEVISIIADPTGDTNLGQFVITLGPHAIATIAALAGAWVQTRLGRRMRFKFDAVEAEVRTVHEINSLLQRLTAFRDGTRVTAEARSSTSSSRSVRRLCRRSLPPPASVPRSASSNSSRRTSATRTPGEPTTALHRNF
jgi:hypothetical protein